MDNYKTIVLGLGFGLSTMAFTTGANAVDLLKTNNTKITLYGQINKGLLSVNDGNDTTTFGIVDNDNSSSRIGVKSTTNLGAGWKLKGKVELQHEIASTGDINQNNRTGTRAQFDLTDDQVIRKIEASIGHKSYGTLTFGQGSTASDGAANIDLSGTKVVSLDPELLAGGILFFDNVTGALSGSRNIGDDFDNLDGGRLLRIRYDTPTIKGFTLSGAYGQQQLRRGNGPRDDRDTWDVALRYKETLGDFKVQGAVFYADREAAVGATNQRTRVGFSAATLHKPTGYNFRIAAGQEDNESRTEKGDFVHVKAGVIKNFFKSGPTAIAVDYYTSNALADEGSQGNSWGLSVVHNFKKPKIELYAALRNYSLDEPGNDFEDVSALLTGIRWKF
ncbi:porin [Amylibacter sp. SFDW26]|uniref:porin n=1 Tax=Amylibacter sp. SFDW26 TaxID=2652722 RepID=UPI00186A7F4A|nr:porin [Amylibacter sp. SFDW26]